MTAVIDFLAGAIPIMVGIGVYEAIMYALGWRRRWHRVTPWWRR